MEVTIKMGKYIQEATVYIDEAGDLGINKGTTWFVLGAVIVNKNDEKGIRQKINSIKTFLNCKEIHFRQLRHFEKRAYVVNNIVNEKFTFCCVVMDTTKVKLIPKNKDVSKSVLLYNYACRYLLERVSWLLRDTHRIGDIVLSSRGTARDNELIDYIKNILLKQSDNEIAPVFKKICSKTAPSWDMLQLADVCATSVFMAYEINKNFGFLLPCYAHKLGNKFYKYGPALLNYGLKYFSPEMEPSKSYFTDNSPCSKA